MAEEPKGRYVQLLSNTFLFALGNLGSKFILFLLVPLYTNALTKNEYGISEIILSSTNLLVPIFSLSIQEAALRFALDKKNNDGEIIKNSILVLLFGVGFAFFAIPLVRLYAPLYEWTNFLVVISILYMFRNVFSFYVKAIGKTNVFALDSVLYTLFLMLLNIVFLVVLKLGLRGYLYAVIISTGISVAFLSLGGNIFSKCIKSKINLSLMKEMVMFSIPMIVNNISWWIINSSDKFMIEHYMSAGDSGIYSVATKMPSLIIMITNIFYQAWVISAVSEYDSNKDSSFFGNIFSVFSVLIIISSSFIVLIIKPFMGIYVGHEFVSSWQYVPLLLLGSIFQSYAMFFGAIYTSAKKNIKVMLTTFIAATINILFNILLINIWGIQGAVIATAVAYFVIFLFRMIDSQNYIKFSIDYLRVITSIIILVIQCIISIFEWHMVLISIFCFITIILINCTTIKSLFLMTYHKIRKLYNCECRK